MKLGFVKGGGILHNFAMRYLLPVLLFGTAFAFEAPRGAFYAPAPSARAWGIGRNTAITLDPLSTIDNPALLSLLSGQSGSSSFRVSSDGFPRNTMFMGLSLHGENSAFSYLPSVKMSDYESTYFQVEGDDTMEVCEKAKFSRDVYLLQSASAQPLSASGSVVGIGLNVKYFQSRLLLARAITGDEGTGVDLIAESGRGVGVDIGFLLSSGPFKVGISVRNLASKIWWKSIKDVVPPRILMLGISLDPLDVMGFRAGLRKGRDEYIPSFGFEVHSGGKSLRGGLYREGEEFTYTFGFSYSISRAIFDFAFEKRSGDDDYRGILSVNLISIQ